MSTEFQHMNRIDNTWMDTWFCFTPSKRPGAACQTWIAPHARYFLVRSCSDLWLTVSPSNTTVVHRSLPFSFSPLSVSGCVLQSIAACDYCQSDRCSVLQRWGYPPLVPFQCMRLYCWYCNLIKESTLMSIYYPAYVRHMGELVPTLHFLLRIFHVLCQLKS